MDKSRKKEIINNYKKDELIKLSQSDDKILADFAKNKLGIKSDKLTFEQLSTIQDDQLIDLIFDKIKEVLAVRYKSNQTECITPDNVIHELNTSLQAIYFTGIFEMYVQMGDTDKFINGATSSELLGLISAYRLFNLDNMADKISHGSTSDIEKESSDRGKIEALKINYIRKHLNKFQLN